MTDYSRDELKEIYLKVQAENEVDRITKTMFLNVTGISEVAIFKAGFRSYPDFQKFCGNSGRGIFLEDWEILDDILSVMRRMQCWPSSRQYRLLGKHSDRNIYKRFGAWNDVREAVRKRAELEGDEQTLEFLVNNQIANKTNSSSTPAPTLESSFPESDLVAIPSTNSELFDDALLNEASEMSKHYEILYCLEREMRANIESILSVHHGNEWWDICVPQEIRDSANRNALKDERAGITPRSIRQIDYTTLGELAVIVDRNWKNFESQIRNREAFQKIMSNLNLMRAYVAHCSSLPPDEVTRLKLTINDWHRQKLT